MKNSIKLVIALTAIGVAIRAKQKRITKGTFTAKEWRNLNKSKRPTYQFSQIPLPSSKALN